MRKKGMRGGKTVAKKVMGMRSGKKVAKKKMRMGGSTSRADTPTGGRTKAPKFTSGYNSQGEVVSVRERMKSGKKVKKMKAGRSVCRGMGAATKGGNFEVV